MIADFERPARAAAVANPALQRMRGEVALESGRGNASRHDLSQRPIR
jgi:hypothetical protein